MSTTRFRYGRATVTHPDGTTSTKAVTALADSTLRIETGAAELSVGVTSAVRLGTRQGWQIVDDEGRTWLVKREGGCGCG